jgi:hypothetical protein
MQSSLLKLCLLLICLLVAYFPVVGSFSLVSPPSHHLSLTKPICASAFPARVRWLECFGRSKARNDLVVMLSSREPPNDEKDDSFTNEAPSSFSALEDDVDLSIIWGKETPEDIERRKARDAQKQLLQKRVDKEQAIVAQLGRVVSIDDTLC